VHRRRFVNVRRAAGLEPLPPVQNEEVAPPVELVEATTTSAEEPR